jgi:beta-galactosidase
MYPKFRAKYPQVPLYGSETSSTVSSRGVYFFPSATQKEDKCLNFQVTSYDTFRPGWASLPDPEFKSLEENPYTAGEFVWTGFDYLGEPTPYNSDPTNLLNFQSDPAQQAALAAELKQFKKIQSPSRSSYFGIVDLCGFKKDRFYLYQAHWRPDFPMVHLLPHWNWAGREGQTTPVYAYSSGDEVELFLNGQSLGKKHINPLEYRFIWPDVTYAPGELKAVAYKNGQKWAETGVKTTGPAAAVQLKADRSTIANDGKDLCFVTTEIQDSNGLTVPTAQDHLTFSIKDGPGEIVATDNGDATDLHTFSLPERNAFNGMALVIVRAKGPGTIHLIAQADGLKAGECTIEVK